MSQQSRTSWGWARIILILPVLLISLVGCEGMTGSAEPKKYEGGGPLPEFKGEEIPEKPVAKAKSK